MDLSPQELRVLGSLIEKEITTPDAYPLSLNALQAAANQRSSRDPVLDLSEDDIRQALHTLEDRGLASPARGSLGSSASRVSKYEHHARTVLNLRRDETALLCLLLLRGPQTPGELRSRADRLYSFDDLAAVTSTLDRLAARPSSQPSETSGPEDTGPLTVVLPRQPGSRELRYTHLLGGGPPPHSAHTPESTLAAPPQSLVVTLESRLAALEARVAALEAAAPQNTRDPSPDSGHTMSFPEEIS